MHNILKKSFLSWQILLLIISACIVFLFSWAYYEYNSQSFSSLKFQNALRQKNIEADNYRSDFCQYLQEDNEWHAVDTTLNKKPDGVDVLVYLEDSLCCWTGQVLPFRQENDSVLLNHVVKMANTWYIINHKKYNQWDIY